MIRTLRAVSPLENGTRCDRTAEPLRLLDCCLVSNGAVAVIVTSPERARDLKQPPVQVLGYATCAPGDNRSTARHPAVETGAKRSGEMAFRMAGITCNDIGTCRLFVRLAELGRPRRRHFVRVPASKIWTPTEDQTIPPLAVAKIG